MGDGTDDKGGAEGGDKSYSGKNPPSLAIYNTQP